MLSVLGGLSYAFFHNYVRYAAYGQVVSRHVELASPWNGVVTALHVRVGEVVRQGDVLFRVESVEMGHRLEEIQDLLQLERARLDAELARLKWEAERLASTAQLVQSDYYERWSELLWEQSVLSDLTQQFARAERLHSQGAVAAEDLDSLRCRVSGQEQRIAQLTEAVDSLRRQTPFDLQIDSTLQDQVKPTLVRIENLQAELRRVRERLDQGVVTSPAMGQVKRIRKYSGEYAQEAETVVEFLVDGSTEIVLYVPQSQSRAWSRGDSLEVSVPPDSDALRCEVVGFAPEMQAAPPAIMRHYGADEVLQPMVLRPLDADRAARLVPGSQVRLPRLNPIAGARSVADRMRGIRQVAAGGADAIQTTAQREFAPGRSGR
jgi:multidrug resistance efflux pump